MSLIACPSKNEDAEAKILNFFCAIANRFCQSYKSKGSEQLQVCYFRSN